MMRAFLCKITKIYLILLLCSLPLLLTGCWDRREINDLALVLAAGLDKKSEHEVKLSVQLAVPQAMGGAPQGQGGQAGNNQPTIVEHAVGRTIYDAMAKLQEKVSRRIFWDHLQAVIIGRQLAKEGIRHDVDFFARHPVPRLHAFVFVSEGEAADILTVFPPLQNSSAKEARELTELRIGLSVSMKDLLQMLIGDANAAALPRIEIFKGKGKKSPGLRVNGTAVFKNGKMVGFIDDRVTRGVLWLRNELKTAAVTIKPKKGQGSISFKMLRSHTKLIPKITDKQLEMKVKIVTDDDVVENNTTVDVMNPKVVKKLRKQLEEEVRDRIQLACGRVQKKMKADIFGFAEAFHRKYPKEWEKAKGHWGEVFPDIKVTVDSKVNIRRPGMSTTPQGYPKDEVKE